MPVPAADHSFFSPQPISPAVARIVADGLDEDRIRSAREQCDQAAELVDHAALGRADLAAVVDAVWLGEWAATIPTFTDTPAPAVAARRAWRAGLDGAGDLLLHSGWLVHLETDDELVVRLRARHPAPTGQAWRRRAAVYTLVTALRSGLGEWGDAGMALDAARQSWGRRSGTAQAMAAMIVEDVPAAQQILIGAGRRADRAAEWEHVMNGGLF
ncbi:hypothetical protein CHIBA101_0059 [Actinomyces sp. Chiba101]|nr:hypothetical protein CHIBA101_0059 [Actinomyces sp. Chiba101]GAV95135.1 hypothetical protein ADENT20671_1916 [Actinomyces denticolens]